MAATKSAARTIQLAQQHAAHGNIQSAAQLLGALIRRSMVKRDVIAAWEAADALNVVPVAVTREGVA